MAVAFVGGLVICDRWMARSIADDATTAPTSKPATSRPTLSADVQAVVDRLAAAYAKGPVRIEGDIMTDFDVAGMKEKKGIRINAIARDAKAFRHEATGQLLIDADGSKIHLFDIARNQYADAPLTGDDAGADAARADALAVVLNQNPALYVALGHEAVDAVSFEGEAVELLAPETVDGRVFDRLESRHAAATRVVWIDRERNTIDRIVFDFTKTLEAGGAAEVKRANLTIHYSKTELGGAPAADNVFAFAPPADATPMRSGGQGEMLTGDPSALEGKPAPAFELKDLDGNTVKFAGGTGEVVVLDFWATWCGPCRESLPHLAAAAAKYAGQGVKVYAINQGEDAGTMKTFLVGAGLKLTALVDEDTEVNGKYGASSIPQTVIIGKDGIVRKVVVGFDPTDSSWLDAAIEAARK